MLQRGLPGWTGQSLKQGGRVVGHHTEAFVGIDTSKSRNAIAVGDGGRGGEVRRLVSQRTGIINQIRTFLLERRVAVRQGFRFLGASWAQALD